MANSRSHNINYGEILMRAVYQPITWALTIIPENNNKAKKLCESRAECDWEVCVGWGEQQSGEC